MTLIVPEGVEVVVRGGGLFASQKIESPERPLIVGRAATHRRHPRPRRHSVRPHRTGPQVAVELSDVARARRARELVVLEGFHAIKHAIRFGGEVLGVWTADLVELEALQKRLAPDLQIEAEVVDVEALKLVVPRAQVVAVAKRPAQPDPDTVLAGPGQVVLLEDPRHLGNLGAVIGLLRPRAPRAS